jgi:protein ImuB
VSLKGAAPVFVAASGVRGAIVACAGPWRTSGDWWDVAWSREEWDVALTSGGVFRIFRDALRGAWYVGGELD